MKYSYIGGHPRHKPDPETDFFKSMSKDERI